MAINIVFCLFGASGSGKTYWKNKIVELGIHNIKSFTTRKPRNENDKEYWYVSEKTFKLAKDKGHLINVNQYQNEWYGTVKSEIKNINGHCVLITDITSIPLLTQDLIDLDDKYHVFIYCECPENLEQIHRNRGTPERLDISKKEKLFFDTMFDKKSWHTIRNEKDMFRLVKQFAR